MRKKRKILNYIIFAIGIFFLLAALIFFNYNVTGNFVEGAGNSVIQVTRIMTPPSEQTEETVVEDAPVEEDSSSFSQETQDEDDEETETTADFQRGESSLPGDISSCQEIDYEGIYTLDRDLETNGTCFEVIVDNVVIDCQGYNITFNDSGIERAIRMDDVSNVTIRNCGFINYSYGIFSDEVNYSTFENNRFMGNSFGVALQFSNHNVIMGNDFYDVGTGINSNSNSFYNNISFNTITDSGTFVYQSGAGGMNYSRFYSNQGDNLSSRFIDMEGSNLVIFNNTVENSETYLIRINKNPGSNISYNTLRNMML